MEAVYSIDSLCHMAKRLMRKAFLKLIFILAIAFLIPQIIAFIIYSRIVPLFLTVSLFIIFTCVLAYLCCHKNSNAPQYCVLSLQDIDSFLNFFRNDSISVKPSIDISVFLKENILVCASIISADNMYEYHKATKCINRWLSKSEAWGREVPIFNNQIKLNIILTNQYEDINVHRNAGQLLSRALPLLKIAIIYNKKELIVPFADEDSDWGELKKYYAVLLLLKDAMSLQP